jgi:hypothetical protein
MIFILWELGAVIWVAATGDIPIGMMYLTIGILFARQSSPKQSVIGLVLVVLALVIAINRLLF